MAKAVVEEAASVMTMVEGGGDGKVEQWQTWQWTAALTLDVAIDGSGVVGCRWC